jgi:hypothetical protein
MTIILSDKNRTETYESLQNAVEGAEAWYCDIGIKLPPWEHRVAKTEDFFTAIADYRKRLGAVLGLEPPEEEKQLFRAGEIKWGG